MRSPPIAQYVSGASGQGPITLSRIRRAGRDLRLDLKRHRHLRADEARKVRDHLVRDTARVAADACRVEGDRAVETPGRRLLRRLRPFRARLDGRRRLTARTRSDGLPARRRRRLRLRVQLPARGLGLDEQAQRPRVVERHVLTAAKATIALLFVVEAVGEGEGVALPGQQHQAVANRLQQHRRVPEPWQVGKRPRGEAGATSRTSTKRTWCSP